MVTVTTIQRVPMSETMAAEIAARIGQRANALATIEYQFDEGFTIRFADVPVRYDAETGRQLIHARIGGVIHKRMREVATAMRTQVARQALRGVPLRVTIPARRLADAA